MSVTLTDLVSAINAELEPEQFQDYCPNGLQVQGVEQVSRIVSGVTASQALIDKAVALKADAILVHHGYFWKGEDPCITGMKQRRLKTLLHHNISLLAYHLPLDAHPKMGNNAQLAELLGIECSGALKPDEKRPVGNVGRLHTAMKAADFAALVEVRLGRKPMLIGDGERQIESVGWCTGGAQGYVEQAALMGVDLYLSGEISEPTVHAARELDVIYMAAGHHATERYGVQALGEVMAQRFDLSHQFVDIDNPV